jgi:hypothetical protein
VEGLLSRTPQTLLNLFVLGDSDYEIKAGKYMLTHMKYGRSCTIKLIKMKEEPTSNDIEKQLHMLNKRFASISSS